MRRVITPEYGYVVRGQSAIYTVPISPIAGVATPTCASPACGMGSGGKGGLLEFCSKHKCLCLAGAAIVLYLLLGK